MSKAKKIIKNIPEEEEYDDSGLINELSDEDKKDLENIQDINIEDYHLANKNNTIFSPQIEVFEPFAAHVDASRTNMSAKQLLQVVTTSNNDSPFILNKNYRAMTDLQSPFIGYALDDGIIIHSLENIIIVYYTNLKKIMHYYAPDSKILVNNALTIKYRIGQDDTKNSFEKDDVIFDYSGQNINSHVPNIGYRTNIMFGSFYGYTAEDAFVASEDFAKRATIDYGEKFFVPITKELKFFKNADENYFYDEGQITTDVLCSYNKVDNSENILSEFSNTSDKQSKFYGKRIKCIGGSTIKKIKVHKLNSEKKFDKLTEDYIYTPELMKEIVKYHKRQIELKKEMFFSLEKVMSEEQAILLSNSTYSQWESNSKLPIAILKEIESQYNIQMDNVDIVLEFELVKSEETTLGDKFANVYAGKGTCSLILPTHLMPKDEYGNPADIIFNPLGLFGRNNWGTIFEISMAKIIEDIQSYTVGKDPSETLKRLKFVNEHFIHKFDKDYYDKINDLIYWVEEDEANWGCFKKDILKNGLYLFIGNFPKFKYYDFINDFILRYEELFNYNITKKVDTVYSKELLQYMRDNNFTSNIFDKDTVEDVPQQVFFGKNYWIKLFHTAYSKYNSIAFSNSYSKSTGEPPRGKKRKGGCHTSWQSGSGAEGHKEGNAFMKELNTIKSVAVKEKMNFKRKMIQSGEYIMKDKYESPVIKTLSNSLHMIGLKFENIETNRGDETYDSNAKEIENVPVDVPIIIGTASEYTRVENNDIFVYEPKDVPKHNPKTGEIINE